MSGRQRLYVVETCKPGAAWRPAQTIHLKLAAYRTRDDAGRDLYNLQVVDAGGGLRVTRYEPGRPPAPEAVCDVVHGPWRTLHPKSSGCP